MATTSYAPDPVELRGRPDPRQALGHIQVVDYFAEFFRSLRSNILRSLLTMLGIIIGTGAVIAVLAIGDGSQADVANRIGSLGTNLISVNPSRFSIGGVRSAANGAATLTYADAEAIGELKPQVAAVAPQVGGNFQITAGPNNTNTGIVGTTTSYPGVQKWNIGEGSFFSDDDVQASNPVAVLGTTTASTLFPDSDAVGQTIKMGGVSFAVIGVMADRTQSGPQDPNDTVIVPITTAHFRLLGGPSLDTSTMRTISIEARSEADIASATTAAQTLLEQRHNINVNAGQADDFQILSQAQLLQVSSGVRQTLTLFLVCIAAISLIVGGIGIMNIMLVSVTERTREIGVRKAVGASARDILMQFVIEALLLSLSGGIIGVIVGPIGALLYGHFSKATIQVTAPPMLLAAGVSMAIGLFFGIYPAQRASQLDPIQALRAE